MTKSIAKKTLLFHVGDRVVRNKAVGSSGGERGDVSGTIVKVIASPHGTGGTRARIRVRWDNGHEAFVEDRQRVLVRRGSLLWPPLVDCPTCGVGPGQPCVGVGDKYSVLWPPPIKRPHRARALAARRLLAKSQPLSGGGHAR